MTHEWKVGDRFSVEGVITETADSDGDYKAIFDGHTIGGCVIAAEMACAKLIHPAAPEPQKLDVTKPVRRVLPTIQVALSARRSTAKGLYLSTILGECVSAQNPILKTSQSRRSWGAVKPS